VRWGSRQDLEGPPGFPGDFRSAQIGADERVKHSPAARIRGPWQRKTFCIVRPIVATAQRRGRFCKRAACRLKRGLSGGDHKTLPENSRLVPTFDELFSGQQSSI
jgi:hypothetical protein